MEPNKEQEAQAQKLEPVPAIVKEWKALVRGAIQRAPWEKVEHRKESKARIVKLKEEIAHERERLADLLAQVDSAVAYRKSQLEDIERLGGRRWPCGCVTAGTDLVCISEACVAKIDYDFKGHAKELLAGYISQKEWIYRDYAKKERAAGREPMSPSMYWEG